MPLGSAKKMMWRVPKGCGQITTSLGNWETSHRLLDRSVNLLSDQSSLQMEDTANTGVSPPLLRPIADAKVLSPAIQKLGQDPMHKGLQRGLPVYPALGYYSRRIREILDTKLTQTV